MIAGTYGEHLGPPPLVPYGSYGPMEHPDYATSVDPCDTEWCVLEDGHYGAHEDKDGNP